MTPKQEFARSLSKAIYFRLTEIYPDLGEDEPRCVHLALSNLEFTWLQEILDQYVLHEDVKERLVWNIEHPG